MFEFRVLFVPVDLWILQVDSQMPKGFFLSHRLVLESITASLLPIQRLIRTCFIPAVGKSEFRAIAGAAEAQRRFGGEKVGVPRLGRRVLRAGLLLHGGALSASLSLPTTSLSARQRPAPAPGISLQQTKLISWKDKQKTTNKACVLE